MPGLGLQFYREVSEAAKRIQFMPFAWTKIGNKTRKCLINGFPYTILYVVEEKKIVVTAVAHQRRNPNHYKNRIE